MEKTSGGDNVGGQNVGEKTSVDEMSGDQIFKINVFFQFFFSKCAYYRTKHYLQQYVQLTMGSVVSGEI